jgi:hypothetical protein
MASSTVLSTPRATQQVRKLGVASSASPQLFWYTRGHQPVSFEFDEILCHEEISLIRPSGPLCESRPQLSVQFRDSIKIDFVHFIQSFYFRYRHGRPPVLQQLSFRLITIERD